MGLALIIGGMAFLLTAMLVSAYPSAEPAAYLTPSPTTAGRPGNPNVSGSLPRTVSTRYIHRLAYPNATVDGTGEATLTLISGDSGSEISDWYRNQLTSLHMKVSVPVHPVSDSSRFTTVTAVDNTREVRVFIDASEPETVRVIVNESFQEETSI